MGRRRFRNDRRGRWGIGLAVVLALVAGGAPADGGREQRLDDVALAAQIVSRVGEAARSAKLAVHGCTLALLRSAGLEAAIDRSRAAVAIRVEREPGCPVDLAGVTRDDLVIVDGAVPPMRLRETRDFEYRRELFLFDDRVLVVSLSDSSGDPRQHLVYEADLALDEGGREFVSDLVGALWTEQGRVLDDPRWSKENHDHLTDEALSGLGFGNRAIALVQEGNAYVDRFFNQLNNPQHSMRDLFQSVEDAQAEAGRWIEAQTEHAVVLTGRGSHCCALFAFGQALHTIQDRKHDWIPLYRHLGADLFSDHYPVWDNDDWQTASRETMVHCRDFVSRVRDRHGDAVVEALTRFAGRNCECGGLEVSVP